MFRTKFPFLAFSSVILVLTLLLAAPALAVPGTSQARKDADEMIAMEKKIAHALGSIGSIQDALPASANLERCVADNIFYINALLLTRVSSFEQLMDVRYGLLADQDEELVGKMDEMLGDVAKMHYVLAGDELDALDRLGKFIHDRRLKKVQRQTRRMIVRFREILKAYE